jgi:hypothetical protein
MLKAKSLEELERERQERVIKNKNDIKNAELSKKEERNNFGAEKNNKVADEQLNELERKRLEKVRQIKLEKERETQMIEESKRKEDEKRKIKDQDSSGEAELGSVRGAFLIRMLLTSKGF